MRAFGYVRLSKMDEGTTSPQRQRAAIKRWCQDRGAELVDTFEDLDLSAYSKRVRRPGLEQMLGRLDEVDTVVTWRLDRLARSVSGFARLLDTFEEARVKVATTDGQVDMTSAAGRAMVQMTAVFAELEAGTTSERARQMLAYKRERGEWVGRVPFGFRLNGKGLEVVPEQFAILQEAAGRYVAGESLRSISQDVGIPHPNLGRMLRSDRVIDTLPKTLAGRLVEALAERGRSGTGSQRSLLGGMARCALCGAGMTVVADRRHREGRSTWAAYSCRERGHVSISKPWLENYVTEQLLEAVDTGEIIKRLAKRRPPRRTVATSELEARLELLERDFYELGSMPRDRYLRRREGLLMRMKAAREAEQEVGIDLPRKQVAQLAKAWPALNVQERRRIVSAVLSRVEVAKASSHGTIDAGRVELVWRGA